MNRPRRKAEEVNRDAARDEPQAQPARGRRTAVWSGSISFGLVAIPVQMRPAVRSEHLAFHLLHDQDHARLQRRLFCPVDGVAVAAEEMIRGVEVAPGRYVTVREEELESLAPKASRTIEIAGFVPQERIDPLYYERPYYLLPDGADKPYALLARALVESKQAGLAKFAMRGHEYWGALQGQGAGLVLTVLHFDSEILEMPRWAQPPVPAEPAAASLEALVRERRTVFQPVKYVNPYREHLATILREKQATEGVVRAPEVPEEEILEPEDLIAALERTVAQARQAHASQSPEQGERGSWNP